MTASVRGPKVERGAEFGRNVIVTAVPAELRVVNYNDGHGKNETKLMLVIPVEGGEPAMFFMPNGFDAGMQVPSDWIKKQMRELLAGGAPAVVSEAVMETPGGLSTVSESLPKPSAVNVMKPVKS